MSEWAPRSGAGFLEEMSVGRGGRGPELGPLAWALPRLLGSSRIGGLCEPPVAAFLLGRLQCRVIKLN